MIAIALTVGRALTDGPCAPLVPSCPDFATSGVQRHAQLLFGAMQMALTALITSVDPSISHRQNTGMDSAEVRLRQAGVQHVAWRPYDQPDSA